MLSRHEESATPRADKPVRAGAVDRRCLRVAPWLDDLIDEVGHDPRSEYIETFWRLVPEQPSPQRPRLSASRCTRRSRQMSRTNGPSAPRHTTCKVRRD
jgi:hypothetical protein